MKHESITTIVIYTETMTSMMTVLDILSSFDATLFRCTNLSKSKAVSCSFLILIFLMILYWSVTLIIWMPRDFLQTNSWRGTFQDQEIVMFCVPNFLIDNKVYVTEKLYNHIDNTTWTQIKAKVCVTLWPWRQTLTKHTVCSYITIVSSIRNVI